MSAPSRETIDFVRKILGARPTPPADLPAVIAAIATGIDALTGTIPTPISVVPAIPAPRLPAEPPQVIVLEMRRRTPRPRRPAALVAETAEIEELPVQPDVEAPSPKLLRRAQATPLKSVLAPSLFRETGGPVRAVVKWFDGKSGKGALRVTGFSGDVALEAPMLAEAGIRRLYKDQEVEATVEHNGDRIRLVGIALPGRMATAAQSVLGSITGQVRRQPRQVTVEVKRDGLRQKQARAEAEQVLGTTGATGNPRRFTS